MYKDATDQRFLFVILLSNLKLVHVIYLSCCHVVEVASEGTELGTNHKACQHQVSVFQL